MTFMTMGWKLTPFIPLGAGPGQANGRSHQIVRKSGQRRRVTGHHPGNRSPELGGGEAPAPVLVCSGPQNVLLAPLRKAASAAGGGGYTRAVSLRRPSRQSPGLILKHETPKRKGKRKRAQKASSSKKKHT